MLLRELVIEEHILTLNEEDDQYIIDIVNKDGEKIFTRGYEEYEEIREILDTIIKEFEDNPMAIDRVLSILKDSV